MPPVTSAIVYKRPPCMLPMKFRLPSPIVSSALAYPSLRARQPYAAVYGKHVVRLKCSPVFFIIHCFRPSSVFFQYNTRREKRYIRTAYVNFLNSAIKDRRFADGHALGPTTA
jgi:hypothetical protein